MADKAVRREQFDVVVLHHHEDEDTAETLLDFLSSLEKDIGHPIKVCSFSSTDQFAIGDRFSTLEDALERASWLFVLVTKPLLSDKRCKFSNNTSLLHSIELDSGKTYVPVFKTRKEVDASWIPTYVKVMKGFIMEEMSKSKMTKNSIIKTIASKLEAREQRENNETLRLELVTRLEGFKVQFETLKHKYEMELIKRQNEIEIEALRREYEEELEQLISISGISKKQLLDEDSDLDLSLSLHELSASFMSSGMSDRLHYVEGGRREPVEHDSQAMEHECQERDDPPPPYQKDSTYEGRMAQAKLFAEPADFVGDGMQPPTVSLEQAMGGRGSPLPVPVCTSYLPAVLDPHHSFPKSLRKPDEDSASMVVETGDGWSIADSQSQANLHDLDDTQLDDVNTQSNGDDDSADSTVEEMDTGENQVDLSLLDTAVGRKPLPLDIIKRDARDDDDNASMIVEVASTIGDNDLTLNESAFITPTETPFKEPPFKVMHRSFCGDNMDDPYIDPLDMSQDSDDGRTSPGLNMVSTAYTWPFRPRRGSETNNRPRTNLNTQRFLSLSSIQSLSSKLFRLHQNPSLNDISELGERPRLLDGIRHRYAW